MILLCKSKFTSHNACADSKKLSHLLTYLFTILLSTSIFISPKHLLSLEIDKNSLLGTFESTLYWQKINFHTQTLTDITIIISHFATFKKKSVVQNSYFLCYLICQQFIFSALILQVCYGSALLLGFWTQYLNKIFKNCQ